MSFNNKYSNDFFDKSFHGCINNKTEILSGEYCGCYNCKQLSNTAEITEWIVEPNGGEDSAACPKCNFDSLLSSKYPVDDQLFLEEMHNFHFGKFD